MSKLESVQPAVERVLAAQTDRACRQDGYAHLYGVAALSAQLALKRGLDSELAGVAGLLHDIYYYRTGLSALHAENSAEEARPLLRDLGLFSAEEQRLIWQAIFHHSRKQAVHGAYDEVLKDADVLQRHLFAPGQPVDDARVARLRRLLPELGLPGKFPPATPAKGVDGALPLAGRRLRLAAVAEELAARPLVGNGQQSGPAVYPLIRYFPGAALSQGFDWCAAFVYHCVLESGVLLPIRHPQASCRFAAVLAWLEWAQLPQVQGFHPANNHDPGFTPGRGDLVVFDRLVSDAEHDHIGVVLRVDAGALVTAEGNVGNRSGIFRRDRCCHVNGFIRIGDAYSYSGEE